MTCVYPQTFRSCFGFDINGFNSVSTLHVVGIITPDDFWKVNFYLFFLLFLKMRSEIVPSFAAYRWFCRISKPQSDGLGSQTMRCIEEKGQNGLVCIDIKP